MPDFFAPAFQVIVNGAALAADVSCNVESISVTTKPDTLDDFSLTVVNTYPRLRWTHTSDSNLFLEGNNVQIALGYVDGLQDVFQGEITKISPNFPESGEPTVIIEGHTKMHRLHASRSTRTFNNITDKQMVERIGADLGFDVEAEDAGVSYDYVIQANQTDLDFVLGLAARIHFELLVIGKKLIFRKCREAAPETYTLVWGYPQEAFAPPSNIFPLTSFAPTLDARQPVCDVSVRGWDVQNKTQFVGRASMSDQNGEMAGSIKAGNVWSSAFKNNRSYIAVRTPVYTQGEADEQARAIYNNRACEMVTGRGKTIGLPQLRAGKVIKLDGLGPRFNGNYYVDESTHTLDQNGYFTTFTVKRNAI
jgi:phage protein D